MPEEKSKPNCPGCGREYDVKYPVNQFDISMVDPKDTTCKEAGYVHVHKHSS
jgi:hypothetical protein